MLNQIKKTLAISHAYRLFWYAVGGNNYMRTLVEGHIRPDKSFRILDIGCGPGTALPYFRACEYTGIDLSEEYIATARKKFPEGTFVCDRVNNYELAQVGHFDRVIALGVVHHLDDVEAHQLFQTAHKALKPGGKLVTVDGVFIEGQSRGARFLLNRDRGEFIRKEKQYRQLAESVFPSINATIRHDLLRVPYSHIIMECNR